MADCRTRGSIYNLPQSCLPPNQNGATTKVPCSREGFIRAKHVRPISVACTSSGSPVSPFWRAHRSIVRELTAVLGYVLSKLYTVACVADRMTMTLNDGVICSHKKNEQSFAHETSKVKTIVLVWHSSKLTGHNFNVFEALLSHKG